MSDARQSRRARPRSKAEEKLTDICGVQHDPPSLRVSQEGPHLIGRWCARVRIVRIRNGRMIRLYVGKDEGTYVLLPNAEAAESQSFPTLFSVTAQGNRSSRATASLSIFNPNTVRSVARKGKKGMLSRREPNVHHELGFEPVLSRLTYLPMLETIPIIANEDSGCFCPVELRSIKTRILMSGWMGTSRFDGWV